jgi:hypothetical protein
MRYIYLIDWKETLPVNLAGRVSPHFFEILFDLLF